MFLESVEAGIEAVFALFHVADLRLRFDRDFQSTLQISAVGTDRAFDPRRVSQPPFDRRMEKRNLDAAANRLRADFL